MNDYGIGAALLAVATVYFRSARRTGRTTTLLNTLQNGDRVVFATAKDKALFMKLAEGRVIIHPLVIDPRQLDSLSQFSRNVTGRTFFDHSWVEAFYRHALTRAGDHLARMIQEDATGYQPPQMDATPEHYQKWDGWCNL